MVYSCFAPSRKGKMPRDSSHRLSDFESWDVVFVLVFGLRFAFCFTFFRGQNRWIYPSVAPSPTISPSPGQSPEDRGNN